MTTEQNESTIPEQQPQHEELKASQESDAAVSTPQESDAAASTPQEADAATSTPDAAAHPEHSEPKEEQEADRQPRGKAQVFSEDQQALIDKLKEQVSDIIVDAEKGSKEPVSSTLWGVPLDAQDDLRVDVILHKFIKARPEGIQQAREMLSNTLRWRAEFNVAGILDEEFPELYKSVGYLYGTDKEGRPVTYNFYGGLDNKAVFGDLDRFLRWRVQLHEKGMRKLDFVDVADMVQVHDYDGVGLFSYDKTAKAASKATIQLMSDNYPETLATKIFANVPGWGETIFNFISRWLSEDTRKKFVVVGKAAAPKALAQRIDQDMIPEKFRVIKASPTPASEKQQQQQQAADEPCAKVSEKGKEPDTGASPEEASTETTEESDVKEVDPPAPEPAHAVADVPAPTEAVDTSGAESNNIQTAAPPEEANEETTPAEEETAGSRPNDKTEDLDAASKTQA